MTILLYCIGAMLLVVTGAVVSGGLRLPHRVPKDGGAPAPADDALSRDLAALMAYGREDRNDEI